MWGVIPMTGSAQNEQRELDKIDREIFLKTVGIRIRRLREQKKWTQEMLAQEARINDKYVYDIETGNKCMTIWVLTKISKALDVKVEHLLANEVNID